MSDRRPPATLFQLQHLRTKSAWLKGVAVSAGGFILLCACMTILTVSACTLGN
jgi:hypothetical protein